MEREVERYLQVLGVRRWRELVADRCKNHTFVYSKVDIYKTDVELGAAECVRKRPSGC